MRKKITVGLILFAAAWQLALEAGPMKVKHLARVRGVRANQLIGYGLVVGLQRTGDSQRMEPTFQSLSNMLKHFGLEVSPASFKAKDVAAVAVTAVLPPFAKSGASIDVNVSAMGDARSLQGGTLLQTNLQGADAQVYAIAQGNLSVGGFAFEGEDFLVRKNQSTVGYIPDGALVEREVPAGIVKDNKLALYLDRPDFTTAARLTRAVNDHFKSELAIAADAGQVLVEVPYDYQHDLVQFIASIESIYIEPETTANKIVVSERTGTVVIGKDVRIDSVAVSHGDLNVLIKRQTRVSKTASFGVEGLVYERVIETDKEEEEGKLIVFPEGVNLIELVEALNVVGASPRDLIAILQAIKKAGALQADLEII